MKSVWFAAIGLSVMASTASAQFVPARWFEGFDSYSTGNLTENSAWVIVDKDCPYTCGDAFVLSSGTFSAPNDATLLDGTTVMYSFVDNPIPGMTGHPVSGQWCISGWAWVDKNNPKGSARIRFCTDDDTMDPKVGAALVFDGTDGKNEKVFLDGHPNDTIVMPTKTWFPWTVAIDLDQGLVSAYANGQTIVENKAWNGPLELEGLWMFGGPEFTTMRVDDLHIESAWGDASHVLTASPNPVPAGTTDLTLSVGSTGWVEKGLTTPGGVIFLTGLDYVPFLEYMPVAFLPLALDGEGDDMWTMTLPSGLSGYVLELRSFFVGRDSKNWPIDSLGNYLQIRFD